MQPTCETRSSTSTCLTNQPSELFLMKQQVQRRKFFPVAVVSDRVLPCFKSLIHERRAYYIPIDTVKQHVLMPNDRQELKHHEQSGWKTTRQMHNHASTHGPFMKVVHIARDNLCWKNFVVIQVLQFCKGKAEHGSCENNI